MDLTEGTIYGKFRNCLKSISGKKYPILKNIKYLGTVERILEVFKFYEKNKK